MVERTAAQGVFLGLACGDALGRPVEFIPGDRLATEYGTVTEMLGQGSHDQPPGTITDDTELALCIARSLVAEERFAPADIAERFVAWYRSDPFDIGMTTMDALRRIKHGTPWDEAGQAVWKDRPEGQNAGNGSVMRCAPYAIAFAEDPATLARVSRQSSAITHADPRCTDGCAVLTLTIAGLLTDRDVPLQTAIEHVQPDAPQALLDAVTPVPDGIDPDELHSGGYVLDTLQTALYYGLTAETAEEGIVAAVNRGHDADTVGAITGALVGARFGVDALPERWIGTLACADALRELATRLATTAIDA